MENNRSNIGLKALVVCGLILGLMIPTLFINNLVFERKNRQNDAFKEVSSKWAEKQTITGPVISIPFMEYFKAADGTVNQARNYIHVLPEELKITGNVVPEKRYRGIYEIIVYGSTINLQGRFKALQTANPKINKKDILFNEAFISVGISDLRGLKEQVNLNWNTESSAFNPGVESKDVVQSGISAPVNLITNENADSEYSFSLNLNLKGSQSLYFTPVGKETFVDLKSNWNSPSFDGAFLPEARNVTDTGFTAHWKVLNLNRNYPQSWSNNSFDVQNSYFGINLYLPIDNYTKTDRSIKYAILFIGLTFLTFFFLELLNRKSIHPLQYILIGFALCIFYILLLSISEQINYNRAYLIAAVMTIGLITWYSRSILKAPKLSTLVAGNLIILYGFIFIIIQLEDLSLLIGSLGLFLILTLVMYFSKRINWSEYSRNKTDVTEIKNAE